jgi:hypothetical protein
VRGYIAAKKKKWPADAGCYKQRRAINFQKHEGAVAKFSMFRRQPRACGCKAGIELHLQRI